MPKKKSHADRDHLECGGSGAHRWPRCSASVFLGRKVGKLPDTKASARGTDTHELAEICVDDFLNNKLLGTDPEKNYRKERTFRDEQQVNAVEFYRDYIWEEVLEHSITNKAWSLEDKIVHAACDKMGGSPDFWCACINDKGERVLHIVDFKNGTDPVSIKHEQFIYYGDCFRSILQEQGKDIDRLVTHLVQPNSLDGVKSQKKAYTPKQMDAKRAWFLKAINKIYVDKKVTFKMGDWCKYCPGQSKCEKYSGKLERDSGLSLLSSEVHSPVEVEALTTEQAVAIAMNGDKLTQLVKACKAFIIGQHMQGTPIEGCKVVQTKPRRSIPKDSTKLEARLIKEGLKRDEMYNEKLKGIGDLEKVLGDKKKLLEKFVTFGKPTASVVSEDDPRPAATNLTDLLL